MGKDEGSCPEASRNGMPQVKGLKELKLPVGSEAFHGQAGRIRRSGHSQRATASLPCFVFPSEPLMNSFS